MLKKPAVGVAFQGFTSSCLSLLSSWTSYRHETRALGPVSLLVVLLGLHIDANLSKITLAWSPILFHTET